MGHRLAPRPPEGPQALEPRQESEADQRKTTFAPYQINAALLSKAPRDCRFLHCLPAKRGLEVTDDVIDGPQSAVIEEAANRMHVQKGLMAWLLGAVE